MGIIIGVTAPKPARRKDPMELNIVYLSISRPSQGSTLWRFSLAVRADHFLSQLIHNDLALQVLHEGKTTSDY